MTGDLSREFITVRLVKCNGLDLSLFQFDCDLTFAVFFFNADRTLYARYGTRSRRDADKDVSLEGLAATMREVLLLHSDYPANAASLAGKQPVAVSHLTPEVYPSLVEFKAKLDYEGRVASSCIHCHQIRDAQRNVIREQEKSIPDSLMFPFPSAEAIGLSFDKQTRSTVIVAKNSAAESAGLKSGDEIDLFNSQKIASESDLRWALDRLNDEKSVPVVVNHREARVELTLQLPKDWRSRDEISWRPTTWDLRRMATGGMVLKPATDSQRAALGISATQMALIADHVGQFNNHARAKEAGLQKGDVILEFDRRDDFINESGLLAYGLQQKKPGDEVAIKYWRSGKTHTTKIKLQ